jgi:uncharacterized protein
MRGEQRINAVLDTNIYISSVFWIGNPHKIIELALDDKIDVYTSPEILTELEKVLKRDFLEDYEFIERQIALILEFSKIVKPERKLDIVKEDPKDNMIVECAVTAKAEYIVTGDPHLLNLKEVYGIKIVKPKEYLEIFRNQKH